METRPFDPAWYLDSEEAIAAFLADAQAYGPQESADAAVVAARARALMARDGLGTALDQAGVAEGRGEGFRHRADET